MPMSFEIKPQEIWFRTSGDVDYAEGIAVLEQGLHEAQQATPSRRWPVVFDIRDSEENRSANELRGIAQFVAAHDGILTGRCAVLTSDALHYGLGRMFEVFSEDLGIEVQVFRDLDSLRAWLDADPSGARD